MGDINLKKVLFSAVLIVSYTVALVYLSGFI